jgi:DNA (cytosine-5)-methyltransferase 3A
MFNASLVSAQSRKRLFWTNIPFTLPEDKGILLKDILQTEVEDFVKNQSVTLTANPKGSQIGYIGNSNGQANRVYDLNGKSVTLSSNGGGLGAKTGLYQVEQRIRKLTAIEAERLQGLPDDYTAGIPKTHRYKCLGNAFNADVVAHIFRAIEQ